MSLPVVILPLDPQSVDADDNLGNIQNVDNIEMQSQPERSPPPPRFLTLGLLRQSLQDFMNCLINFRGLEPLHLKM